MENNNFSLNDNVAKKTVIFFAEISVLSRCKLKNYSSYHKILSSCNSDT